MFSTHAFSKSWEEFDEKVKKSINNFEPNIEE